MPLSPNTQEFVITRTFDAPRDLVWKAFTEQKHLAQWWGPPGSTVKNAEMDLRPGGRYHFCSAFPDGNRIWGLFRFLDITPVEKILYLHSFSDEAGNVAASPFGGPWPARIHTSLLFTDEGGKTGFTLRQFPLDASPEEEEAFNALFEGMRMGWGATLDNLDAYLAKVRA
jgi:uncharacterized protein YndB with AHSA1/START domain